jgi:hypothetical protein
MRAPIVMGRALFARATRPLEAAAVQFAIILLVFWRVSNRGLVGEPDHASFTSDRQKDDSSVLVY